MAGRTETDVSGPASVTLTLERLAARVRLDIETAPEIAGRLNILEVQPLSVPSGVVCFSGDAVGEFGDWPPQECGTSAFSAVYYLPENLAGEIPHIASPEERTHLNAPEDATGFRISTLYEGKPVYYHVYPGDNGTSDFNLRRNRTYVLNVTLCGANPEDARVAACDMTLTPSAGEVQAGQTFSTRLCFTARNNADNTFDLAWRFISGEAEVSVSGGLPDPPGVFYYGLAGNEIDEYFDIAVTSDGKGPWNWSSTHGPLRAGFRTPGHGELSGRRPDRLHGHVRLRRGTHEPQRFRADAAGHRQGYRGRLGAAARTLGGSRSTTTGPASIRTIRTVLSVIPTPTPPLLKAGARGTSQYLFDAGREMLRQPIYHIDGYYTRDGFMVVEGGGMTVTSVSEPPSGYTYNVLAPEVRYRGPGF